MGKDNLGAFLYVDVTGCITSLFDADKPVEPVIRSKSPATAVTLTHQDGRMILHTLQSIGEYAELLILPVIIIGVVWSAVR